LKERVGYYRIVGTNGILMPSFASAVGIQDVRYANSMVEESYQHFRSGNLQTSELSWSSSSSLWFTGGSELDIDITKSEDTEIHRVPTDLGNDLEANLPSYSFLGVKYVLTPRTYQWPQGRAGKFLPSNHFREVYSGEVKIFENRDVLPRAFVVYRAERFPTLADVQQAIRTPNFSFRQVAVLEDPVPSWYKPISKSPAATPTTPSSALITSYGLNHVGITVNSPMEGILVLTDVYDPGWHAIVDGHPSRIVRVDGLVRGVHLEAGKHLVVFRYAPGSFRTGAALALVASLSCLTLLGLLFRDARRG